jgi:hypothetical protein
MPLTVSHGKHQNREDQDDDGSKQGASRLEVRIERVGPYKYYYKYRYLLYCPNFFYP